MNFADKCAAWHVAFDAMLAAFDSSAALTDEIETPVVPGALSEVIRAADGTERQPLEGLADGRHWTADELQWMLDRGGFSFAENRTDGDRIIVETGIRPFSPDGLKQVRQLLEVAQKYELAKSEYFERCKNIEAVPNEMNMQLWDHAMALIRLPSACAADLAEKVRIADRLQILDSRGADIDEIIRTVFSEVRCLAEAQSAGVAA